MLMWLWLWLWSLSLVVGRWSLVVGRWSLFVARCSLLVARCSLLLAPCSLLLAPCSLLVVVVVVRCCKMVVIPRFERINCVIQEIFSVLHSSTLLCINSTTLWFIPDSRHTVWRPFSGLKKGHPRGLRGILFTSTSLLVVPDFCCRYCGFTIATPTTAAATNTTIRNGLLPGAATATLFGPPGARNGQKGSPRSLWGILLNQNSTLEE